MIVFLFSLIAWLICTAMSWIVTCGLVYLVTICFGWGFDWTIATGIWLVLSILDLTFS